MNGYHIRCTYIFLYCFMVLSCSACFWRNCPPGGKRGMPETPPINVDRECMSCGPALDGQCVGPNICCSPTSGCHINSEYSKPCIHENDNTTPCKVEGKLCGDYGNCVADGVCCTSEMCQMDSKCKIVQEKSYDPEFLKFLRKLLVASIKLRERNSELYKR